MKWIVLLRSCPHTVLQSPSYQFFFSTPRMLLFIFARQTGPSKWSTRSSSRFLFTTSAAGFSGLLAGHLAGKIFSVSIAACSWKNLHIPCCIIHPFSKPTYSCSGSHGAWGLSQHALDGGRSCTGHKHSPSPTQMHAFIPVGNLVLLFIIIVTLLMSNNPNVSRHRAVVKYSGLWGICQQGWGLLHGSTQSPL